MKENHLSRKILFGELVNGKCLSNGQKICLEDRFLTTLKRTGCMPA